MGVPLKYNIRNLVERKATTIMTAVGVGLTVAVLVTSVALTQGMEAVFAGSGHPLQVLVLRKSADAELSSTVSESAIQVIRALPGIAKGPDGQPLASPEGMQVVNLPSVENPDGMNVSIRGVLPVGVKLRDEIKLVRGEWNTPGQRQVVVGEGIASRYPDARVGGKLKFGRGTWDVVGEFSAGDSAHNSEIWTDLNQLRGDFETSGGSSSVLVRLENAGAIEGFKKTIEGDQRLTLQALGEVEYYEKTKKMSNGIMLQFIGFFVAVVMAVGAGFAATNTMYAAVARRAREIGTLRAIGFGRFAIMRSFVFESVVLALIGGLLGCAIAFPLNNMSAGVGNWQTFSEMAFKFKVTPVAIAIGLAFAATIGFLGGLLPAWSAARKNVIAAMREG
jgi:putative ABC transport system permease protein